MKKVCGNCGIEEAPKVGLFWSRTWGLVCKSCRYCIECKKRVADAPRTAQSPSYPICQVCLKEGWITDPIEIATEIAADPELRQILSQEKPLEDK